MTATEKILARASEKCEVWDREKIVVIPDHYIFTNDERAHRNVDIARDFCMEQDIKYFYDIQDRSNFRVSKDCSFNDNGKVPVEEEALLSFKSTQERGHTDNGAPQFLAEFAHLP
ncbi:hypothetical protein TSUD_27200 [Trifolium subterraneum]|uniref:Uncharacterized protein n=1 Tax=Trifolium subterraneum TaxID=3900 RepID=A0A2Z6LWA4_TRISU|nr:hypothetical protein TSUD_27200 [Trifolium subterraneum]